MVADSAAIASKLGPRDALITGAIGFVALYYLLPWVIVLWAEHNKTKMAAGPVGDAMRQVVDALFLRRFIHPLEWAGVAVLLVCVGIANWKAFARTDLDYEGRRDMTFLSKLIARFLD